MPEDKWTGVDPIKLDDHSDRHEDGGGDEISVTGLSGLLADPQHVLSNEIDYGLSFEGVVTTATDNQHFKVSTLAGKGTGFFIPTAGDPYEIYVVQADGAAPEGQHKPVLAYTTGDGTFQHAAFTTNDLAVGDIVLIIHPWLARMLDLYTDWKNGGRLDLLIDAIIADITSAVDEAPTPKSLHDILHKDSNYTFDNTTDALEAISDAVDEQHQHVHILFIIPEAVGNITGDNAILLIELQKLGDVETITQGDALEFPAFGGYAMAVMGTENGAASWTTNNLADLKNILGLTLVCVDNVTAAYFEIGTGGTAASKTVIRAISEIEGTKMGLGEEAGHYPATGLNTGNNTVTSSATYHTLDMSDGNITETVFCTESVDPDTGSANTDVTMGVIRRIQNDGTIGVDEAGTDIPATLAFCGFAYEGDKLTTLGKATFYLFCHTLIQLRIQEASVETGGLVADLRKRLFGNMVGSFGTGNPMVEYIAGKDNVGNKLPVGESLYDILLDVIADTEDIQSILGTPANFMANVASLALEATLDTHDTDIKALLSTIAGYLTTEIADILTDTGSTIPGLLSTIQTDLDNPSQYKATGFATETKQDIIDGYHDVPGEDSASDAQIRDVVGKKSDTTGGNSLVALIKVIDGIIDDLHDTDLPAVKSVLDALENLSAANVATELETYDAVKRSEATSDKNAIIAEIDTNEGKLDTLITRITAAVALASTLEDAMQKATGPAYNQDTDSLEAIREAIDVIDGIVDTITGRVTAAVATATALTAAKAVIDAIKTIVDTPANFMADVSGITTSGPTLTQMNTAHGLLATPAQVTTALNNYDPPTRTEATSDKDAVIAAIPAMVGTNNAATETKQDIIDTNVDDIEADTNELQTDWANGGRLDNLLDDAIAAGGGYTHTDWRGSFSFTTAYGTDETDISNLFSTNLAIATRRKYSVKLDLTTIEADGSFTELYLAVKEKIDGTNYRAIDRKTITKANIAATAEPGIIIDIPASSENIQITIQMETTLAGNKTIYYAVVKEHLE